MPENWKTYQFANAPLTIMDGDRGKNYPKSNEFKSKGHCLFLSAKNVTKTGFQFSEKIFISKERDELLGKGKLEKYDLVLTTRGTVGNVAYYGDGVPFEHIRINSGMVIIRVKKEALEDKFLYFFLRSPNFENQVLSNQTGSAQPQLPIRDLKTLKIKLPPLPEQKSIASILSALDDKIELNLQMNKTLEEKAMALYKHWFTDFGPFQDGELVATELGEIPKGWEVRSLGEVTELSAGGDKPKKFTKNIQNNNKIPIYSNGIKDEGLYGYTDKSKIDEESVTISARGTIGFVCLRSQPYFPIVRLISAIPIQNIISSKYLYLCLKNKNISGTGTTQQQLTVPDFSRLRLVIPPLEIVRDFTQVVDSIYLTINSNKSENNTLTKLRDTLLPKLISGEVRVKDAEKTLSEVL